MMADKGRRGGLLDAVFAAGRGRGRQLRRNGIVLLALAGLVTGMEVSALYGAGWQFTPFHVTVLQVIGGFAVLALLLLLGSGRVEAADRRYRARQRAEALELEFARREADRRHRRQAEADADREQGERIDRYAASLNTTT